MAVNPHFLSEMDVTPTLQLRDDLDFPHSGIFKALHLATKGTYIIKESATDFDITQSTSGGFTQLQVKGGAGFRQGAYVQIGSGSGTTTNITMNTSYDPGTGGVDITPVSSDVYLLMVATAANVIVLRGSNTTTNKLPEWIDGDIPIAVVKVAASSVDSATDRPIQYLTTDQDDNSLSIGYASSNNYVEAMSISSDTAGEVTIANKVSNKDLLFTINDGGSTKTLMTLDSSAMAVVMHSDHTSTALRLESSSTSSGSAPDLILQRTDIIDAGGTPDNEQLAVISFQGENDNNQNVEYARIVAIVQDVTDTTEDGEIQINVCKDGTEMRAGLSVGADEVVVNDGSLDIDFRVESDGNINMLKVDGANNRVGIGISPSETLHINGDIRVDGTTLGATGNPLTVSDDDPVTPTITGHMGWLQINISGATRYIPFFA